MGFFLFFSMLIASVSSMELRSCDDLHEVFNMAKERNVNTTVESSATIQCEELTTFTLDGYDMGVYYAGDDGRTYVTVDLYNVRFETMGGSELTWEPNVNFEYKREDLEHVEDLPDFEGGALHIGEGSTVNFLNDFQTTNVGILSESRTDGGCVWNQGKLSVRGNTIMTNCENYGFEDGSGGEGGAIFNGVNGTVNMNNVEISESYAQESNGGGFFNSGKVSIFGISTFSGMMSKNGGAIFNDIGGVFTFKKNTNMVFSDCRADKTGGAVYNLGTFKFSGLASVFTAGSSSSRGGQIYIGEGGYMKLKNTSLFMNNKSEEGTGAAVFVQSGGQFYYYKKEAFFVNNKSVYEESTCQGVFYEDGEKCLE